MLNIDTRSPVHTSQFFENEKMRKNDQLKIINSYIKNPTTIIYIY